MNFGNYKMLSVHTTNARVIKNFRSSLEEFQAEVRNAGLEERMHIMCSMEREIHIHKTSKQKPRKKISSRPSGIGDYRIKKRE